MESATNSLFFLPLFEIFDLAAYNPYQGYHTGKEVELYTEDYWIELPPLPADFDYFQRFSTATYKNDLYVFGKYFLPMFESDEL